MDLGSPLTLPCGAILPNRLCKAAMTEGLSPDGRPTEGHIQLYRMWAKSTAGLLITGNVQVDRHHLERPGNVVLQNGNAPPDARAVFEQWADAARSGGGKVWMQLSHAGRQTPALVNPHPYAPSAVPLAIPGRFGSPLQMPESLIKHLVGSFARASAVAQAYGFDGVQVHAAHGYLLSSFLSPRTNLRTDAWGGSLDRRARLLLEIVGAVRAEVGPNFPVSVKLNSADFQRGGFTEGCHLHAVVTQEPVDTIGHGAHLSTAFGVGQVLDRVWIGGIGDRSGSRSANPENARSMRASSVRAPA